MNTSKLKEQLASVHSSVQARGVVLQMQHGVAALALYKHLVDSHGTATIFSIVLQDHLPMSALRATMKLMESTQVSAAALIIEAGGLSDLAQKATAEAATASISEMEALAKSHD